MNRIGAIIWLLGIGLYDLALSSMMHPSLIINLVAGIIVLFFLVSSMLFQSDAVVLRDAIRNIRPIRNVFFWFAICLLSAACLYAFWQNANNGMLRLLSDNPSMRVDFTNGYLYRLSVPLSILFWYTCRRGGTRIGRVLSAALFVLFVFVTACDLSRGPLLWIITGIILFELLIRAEKSNNAKLSPRAWMLLILALVAISWAFDYFGSLRTANIFKTTASNYYDMKVRLPSGLSWIYIYLCSPLENARYALENSVVNSPTLSANLFYPVYKLIANIIGQGDNFSNWVNSHSELHAYLIGSYGLNVGTFILDALQDFWTLGIVIYLFAYVGVNALTKQIISSKKINPITKLIVYSLAFQGPLWSIFSNSVVFGPIWVCILIFMLVDFLTLRVFAISPSAKSDQNTLRSIDGEISRNQNRFNNFDTTYIHTQSRTFERSNKYRYERGV